MAKKRKLKEQSSLDPFEEKEWGYDYLKKTYLDWIEGTDGHRTKSIIAIVVAVGLIVAASFLTFLPTFVPALISFPAGMMLFGVYLGYRHLNPPANPLKERQSFAQRVRTSILVGAIGFIVLIMFGATIAPAVGGALMVVLAFSLIDFIRRTPEEMALALAGVPDPRDVIEDSEEEEFEEQELSDEEFQALQAQYEQESVRRAGSNAGSPGVEEAVADSPADDLDEGIFTDERFNS